MKTFIKIENRLGGIEAQDWVRMLRDMYRGWAQRCGYRVDVVSSEPGDGDGLRLATLAIDCDAAQLLGEVGVHRLVRVSPFDETKRRHTSFALVRVSSSAEDEKLSVDVPVTGYSQARSYVLAPYRLITDHGTDKKTDRVDEVLAGNLDALLAAA